MIYVSQEAHAFLKANGGASYASALIEREACFTEFEVLDGSVQHKATGIKFTLNEDGKAVASGELSQLGNYDLADMLFRAAFLLKSVRENPLPVGRIL